MAIIQPWLRLTFYEHVELGFVTSCPSLVHSDNSVQKRLSLSPVSAHVRCTGDHAIPLLFFGQEVRHKLGSEFPESQDASDDVMRSAVADVEVLCD